MTESDQVDQASVAKAALLIALGNIASRVLGLLRDVAIAHYFGATGAVSAFRTAEFIPRQIYDLLVGGMISSALVPVFSQYAEKGRPTLWHIASLILSLAIIILGLAVVIAEAAAPQIAALLGANDLDPVLTTRLLRITLPAMFFLSVSGVLTGLLHALKRFVFPAFTAATFNAAIVITTVLGTTIFNLGVEIVAGGLVLGSVAQILIQLPGLRGARFHFEIDLSHPILRQIGSLYQPIILGLLITLLQTSLDRRLANSTDESSLAWMQNATTLIQFPMGLIAVAISLATLPTLSRYAAQTLDYGATTKASIRFIETLTSGLKIVLILIIPATIALFILGAPIISLLFEHGDFTAFDTRQTNLALRFYLLGLIFAAVDQPLIFAFYARQDTFTPAIVGVASVGVYLIMVLLPQLVRPLQMTDLVLADSVKHFSHVLMMFWVIRRLGSLRGQGLLTTTIKASAAATGMGLVLWGLVQGLSRLDLLRGLVAEFTIVGLSMIGGGGVYLLLLWLMQADEVLILWRLVKKKTGWQS